MTKECQHEFEHIYDEELSYDVTKDKATLHIFLESGQLIENAKVKKYVQSVCNKCGKIILKMSQ